MNFCEWVQNSLAVNIPPLSPTPSAPAPNVSVCSPSSKYCHFWGHSWFAAMGLMAPVFWEVLGLWQRALAFPFPRGSAVLFPSKHKGRDPGWMGVILAVCLHWRVEHLFSIRPEFQAVLFYRDGGAQYLEHSHPLQTRASVQGCLYCSAFPESQCLIPEFLNSASQPDCCWPSQPELSMLQIAVCQHGLYLKPDFSPI